jgi:hypothetical protein
MYGARLKDDLSVTRFYTTLDIYQTMKKINEFDSELRKVIEGGNIEQQGIYFIRKDDQNRLLPCSPNKILLSNITTLSPFKRLLPIGFQTKAMGKIKKIIEEIDNIIFNLGISENPYIVNIDVAKKLINLINETLEFEVGYEWDIKAFLGSAEYLSNHGSINGDGNGEIMLLVRKDKNLSRIREDGRFSNAPDTSKIEGLIARENAIDIPMLMLFRQNGLEEKGWKGYPFWWPVLYVPKNAKTVIFASEIVE